MADSETEAETEADATGDDDDDTDTDMAAAMAEMEAAGEDGDTDMAAAMAEMEATGEAPAAPPPAASRAARSGGPIPAVHDAEVEVAAILGRASMDMSQILKLGRGAIIELNANQDSPVGIFAGDTLIAWGEITVIEDSLAVTITDMVKSKKR